MKCPYCGSYCADNTLYCPNCKQPLPTGDAAQKREKAEKAAPRRSVWQRALGVAVALMTLCALAASEAGEASAALSAIPGAAENGLCAALIGALDALRDMQKTLSESPESAAALSGMLRCAQIETILRQKELIEALGIR